MGPRPGELTAVLERGSAEGASRGEEWMYHWALKAGLSVHNGGEQECTMSVGCSLNVLKSSGCGCSCQR